MWRGRERGRKREWQNNALWSLTSLTLTLVAIAKDWNARFCTPLGRTAVEYYPGPTLG